MSERTHGGLKARVAERYRQSREAMQENPDAGCISAGAMLALGRLPFKGLTAVGLVAGGILTMGHYLKAMESPNSADLDKAKTSAHIELVKFDPDQEIKVAEAYFQVTLDARGIPLKIERAKDCELNLEMSGLGATRYDVPFSAITQHPNPETNKIDFEVDPTQITVTGHWDDVGPDLQPYTVDDGRKNFGDRKGFWCSWNGAIAGFGRLAGRDGFANAMDDLETNVGKDMKHKGLELFTERCSQPLKPAMKKATKLALVQNLVMLGRGDVVGEVDFSEGDFNVSTGLKEYKYVYKDFKVDRVDCETDPKLIDEALEGGTDE